MELLRCLRIARPVELPEQIPLVFENGRVADLFGADYTFLDARLATLYGVAGSFDDRSAYAPYANLLLKGAAGVTQNLYSVSALQRKGSQDFLLAEKVPGRDAQIGGVPLPTTLWLLAAAVAALALRGVARR